SFQRVVLFGKRRKVHDVPLFALFHLAYKAARKIVLVPASLYEDDRRFWFEPRVDVVVEPLRDVLASDGAFRGTAAFYRIVDDHKPCTEARNSAADTDGTHPAAHLRLPFVGRLSVVRHRDELLDDALHTPRKSVRELLTVARENDVELRVARNSPCGITYRYKLALSV